MSDRCCKCTVNLGEADLFHPFPYMVLHKDYPREEAFMRMKKLLCHNCLNECMKWGEEGND